MSINDSYDRWCYEVANGRTQLSYGDWRVQLAAAVPVPGTPLTLGQHWAAEKSVHFIRSVDWARKNSAPYRCGAMTGHASTLPASVTCTDCLGLIEGGGTPTPLHQPPRMEDENGLIDGVFTFTDTHLGKEYTLEVVPQTTGNVEITITDPAESTMFTLHHLDRADLLRALLYDFHYSPERGGPNGG